MNAALCHPVSSQAAVLGLGSGSHSGNSGVLREAARAVAVIMATVVGLTFLFGFGNVLSLALRLGVPVWVAPLIAPAVDLSILGLLLATRYLALHGASAEALQPLRRFTLFVNAVTLALNVADPLLSGDYGKAAFDTVGPVLLIGWAEVGPGMLRSISLIASSPRAEIAPAEHDQGKLDTIVVGKEDDLYRARQADAEHWLVHMRPISADTLRTELGVGVDCARDLVTALRAEVAAVVSARAEVAAEVSGQVAVAILRVLSTPDLLPVDRAPAGGWGVTAEGMSCRTVALV